MQDRAWRKALSQFFQKFLNRTGRARKINSNSGGIIADRSGKIPSMSESSHAGSDAASLHKAGKFEADAHVIRIRHDSMPQADQGDSARSFDVSRTDSSIRLRSSSRKLHQSSMPSPRSALVTKEESCG